jgi:hypothetical protein
MKLTVERLVLFTAVGKIVEDGKRALGKCIDHFTDLADRIHSLHRSGLTVDEIMQKEFGGEHPFCRLTDGQFSTANLVKSLLENVS